MFKLQDIYDYVGISSKQCESLCKEAIQKLSFVAFFDQVTIPGTPFLQD